MLPQEGRETADIPERNSLSAHYRGPAGFLPSRGCSSQNVRWGEQFSSFHLFQNLSRNHVNNEIPNKFHAYTSTCISHALSKPSKSKRIFKIRPILRSYYLDITWFNVIHTPLKYISKKANPQGPWWECDPLGLTRRKFNHHPSSQFCEYVLLASQVLITPWMNEQIMARGRSSEQ